MPKFDGDQIEGTKLLPTSARQPSLTKRVATLEQPHQRGRTVVVESLVLQTRKQRLSEPLLYALPSGWVTV